MKKITSKTSQKIDFEGLAKRMGAKLIGGVTGLTDITAAARWFSRRQAAIKKAYAAGIDSGHHVRIWLKSDGKSIAGLVEEISEASGCDFSVLIACVDGGEISIRQDDIERFIDFGKALCVQKVGRYKGWKWWEK